MYRLLFGFLAVLSLAADGDTRAWRKTARRRLGGNSCVDDIVTQELSENADPDADVSLVIALHLDEGPNGKERCLIEGHLLCQRLGSDVETNSLYCNDDFNYVGPETIDADSAYSCLRFVYGVKAGEREAVEAIVAEADSDSVVAVSNVDTEISVDACQQQSTSAWGLGFLDRYSTESSGPNVFEYDSNDGDGTVAYVIDTGVSQHQDFGNRIIGGRNFMDDTADYSDLQGHGTHVAGTIASSSYGVAKKASIYAINIFGSSSTTSTTLIVQAIQHAFDTAKANGEMAVINLSLGGGRNSAEDDLVNAVVANGISVVVSAGNAAINACDYSPARAALALTVAASNSGGNMASFSNYGQCVDIVAPGQSIISTTPGNTYNTFSGTSMSAPHVAGVVCQIMSRHQISDPDAVYPLITGTGAMYSAADQLGGIPSGVGRDATPNLVLQSPCIPPGPINECEMNQNLCNSGTCTDLDDGYQCDCPANYQGDHCELFDECTHANPCQNGATCSDLADGYSCACTPSFSGQNCDTYNSPPSGCTCITMQHNRWGQVGDYCDTWGNYPVWCYIDTNDDTCVNSNESVIPGARWVDCEQSTGPAPTPIPTAPPVPTNEPTAAPTDDPTADPTLAPVPPTFNPTENPTKTPTFSPTPAPTPPTAFPTRTPTLDPTADPTESPTKTPTFSPTRAPTPPTALPTANPTADPTSDPTLAPTSTATGACADVTVDCNGGTCVENEDDEEYTCDCPLDRNGDHCEVLYTPPGDCLCVTQDGGNFGSFDVCNTETQFAPWCYVVGDCEKHSSNAIPGAYWAECVPDADEPTTTEAPDLPDIEVKICESYAWWGYERRCCYKGLGEYDYQSFGEPGCPRENKVRYIDVPEGAKVTVYDHGLFYGYWWVQTAGWQYYGNWISSMKIERV